MPFPIKAASLTVVGKTVSEARRLRSQLQRQSHKDVFITDEAGVPLCPPISWTNCFEQRPNGWTNIEIAGCGLSRRGMTDLQYVARPAITPRSQPTAHTVGTERSRQHDVKRSKRR